MHLRRGLLAVHALITCIFPILQFLSKRLVGSYVGNRQEAAEALQLAASGKIHTRYVIKPLEELPNMQVLISRMKTADAHIPLSRNSYEQMHSGQLAGRYAKLLNWTRVI